LDRTWFVQGINLYFGRLVYGSLGLFPEEEHRRKDESISGFVMYGRALRINQRIGEPGARKQKGERPLEKRAITQETEAPPHTLDRIGSQMVCCSLRTFGLFPEEEHRRKDESVSAFVREPIRSPDEIFGF
jgi:hypothetical protein